VSRATISKIERAESSPTATVLNKLSVGFGIPLPDLFGPSHYNHPRLADRHPISTRKTQAEWHDPEAGYRRWTLTPAGSNQAMKLSEIVLSPGGRITFEAAAGSQALHQQIWVLEGRLELRTGIDIRQIGAGDCIALNMDSPLALRNPGKSKVRYLLAAP
jgi:transcriptional regulator with XRE-family HTH domain